MREPRITLEKLIILRKDVMEAYLIATDEDELPISNNQDNEYFEPLREVIKGKLGIKLCKVPGGETLRKFFFVDEYLSYSLSTLKIFKEFVKACKPESEIKVDKKISPVTLAEISDVINFKGAKLIDSTFKHKILASQYAYTRKDFYLGKHIEESQWYGVVRNWDVERYIYHKVKEQIVKCFSTNSRVAVVIYGAGGCGKSTFLRRIAIDCIDEDFNILWLTDPNDFYNNEFEFFENTDKKYLLFIDDWDLLGKYSVLSDKFLNKIVSVDNIRLIIGDRNIVEKRYLKYLYGNNVFELLSNENEKIITKVIEFVPDWEKVLEKLLLSTGINKVPLYLTLFVLTRTAKANESIDTNDLLALFRDIVANDLKKICQLYNGLALALYYWSCIYKEYHIYISWSGFLKIADYYNGNTLISKRLSQFEQNTAIHKILFNYIEIKEFINIDLKGVHILTFHHDLLVEEGLSHHFIVLKNWHHFDASITYEIFEILLKSKELISCVDLFDCLKKDEPITEENLYNNKLIKVLKNMDDVSSLLDNMYNNLGFSELIRSENWLESFYHDSRASMNDEVWRVIIKRWVYEKCSIEYMRTVLNKIIKDGCKSKYVLSMYDFILSNETEIIKNYLGSLNEDQIINKNNT